MKTLLTILGFIALGNFFLNSEKLEMLEVQPFNCNIDLQVKLLPDGLNNFSSKQPTKQEIICLVNRLGINTIIRLNGNEGGLTVEEEKELCDSLKITFIRMDAHQGYEVGLGYVGSNYEAHKRLLRGNVWIHCKHGHDRTGSVTAYHLRKLGLTKEDIIIHNDWEDYLKKKGKKYSKYYETINTINTDYQF